MVGWLLNKELGAYLGKQVNSVTNLTDICFIMPLSN
jgi:hypothetical protein